MEMASNIFYIKKQQAVIACCFFIQSIEVIYNLYTAISIGPFTSFLAIFTASAALEA